MTPDLVHVEPIAARSRLHNWEIAPHRHHGLFQLLWLERGRARLHLDGVEDGLEAGVVLMLPEHCVHGFSFSPDARGLVITMAYALLARLGDEIAVRLHATGRPRQCRLADLAAREPVETLLRGLGDEYGSVAEHRGLLLESLVGALLAWLMRAPEQLPELPDAGPARRYVARFSEEIERSYARHVPLERYAAILGISSAHLNAVCRQVAGRSALEMIHARLVLEARRSLVYTSMSIRDIAESLGFGDPAYFTRFFRQRSGGLSPRDFRQRATSLATGRDAGDARR